MTMFGSLDATRLAARLSTDDDPDRWVRTAPVPVRVTVAREPASTYSWWTLVRNPQAVLMTGLVGTMMAGDALRRVALGT